MQVATQASRLAKRNHGVTSKVQRQYFGKKEQLIRITQNSSRTNISTRRSGTPWDREEHERFLRALEKYPLGPWKIIACEVGTRTTRQTMTHAQKYREKIARRKRLGEQVTPLLQYSSFMAAPDVHAEASKTQAEKTVEVEKDKKTQRNGRGEYSHAVVTMSEAGAIAVGCDAHVPEPDAALALSTVESASIHIPADAPALSFQSADLLVTNVRPSDEEAGDVVDASIMQLLESSEPLELGDDGTFWIDLSTTTTLRHESDEA